MSIYCLYYTNCPERHSFLFIYAWLHCIPHCGPAPPFPHIWRTNYQIPPLPFPHFLVRAASGLDRISKNGNTCPGGGGGGHLRKAKWIFLSNGNATANTYRMSLLSIINRSSNFWVKILSIRYEIFYQCLTLYRGSLLCLSPNSYFHVAQVDCAGSVASTR